jgi:hypothetical protein
MEIAKSIRRGELPALQQLNKAEIKFGFFCFKFKTIFIMLNNTGNT